MIKVLHFSPVRKAPEILKLHLQSLQELNLKGIEFTYSFFDDNTDKVSSDILSSFIKKNSNSFVHNFNIDDLPNYLGEERWVIPLYERITLIKNRVIDFVITNNYDYLFITDSDLIIHPQTLKNLLHQQKAFCSTIFWTHFDNKITYTPNAWFSKANGFSKEDLLNFRGKATFAVDFTGACSLLSAKMLREGVNFKKIPNLNFLGEDKHFCIRASVLGYQAYVNTEFPAYHVYKENEVELGKKLLKSGFKFNYLDLWLDDEWTGKIDSWLKPRRKSLIKKIFLKLSR